MDPQTGEYNLKFNMQNILEDFYIPVRGGDTTTKIETTKGLDYTAIEDVEYLKNKLFAALKIPKAYLGYESDLTGKATLAAEDIRFARTVERLQKILVSELTKIALVHLYSQGYDGEALTNFELSLTVPSIIYEQEKIALLKEKSALATELIQNKIVPTDWVYDHIFNFSENEYDEYRDLIIEDAKRKFRIDQIETEGNDPSKTGEAYGTPHTLASLYGSSRYPGTEGVPKGYDEDGDTYPDQILGRPKEKASNINTQEDPLGKDRLGRAGMKNGDDEAKGFRTAYKGGSPLALENASTQAVYHQISNNLKNMFPQRKLSLFEESDLLNENNLLKEDK